jgi:predicted transcriptional regulator
MKDQLETLANVTGRSKSFLAAEAIEAYLTTQAWQVQAIAEAVTEADSPDARFVDHQDMVDWANKRKQRTKKA